MTWKIFDHTHQHVYTFDKKTVSVGRHEECEIKLSQFKNKAIHSQIILEDGFLFHICDNTLHPYFLKADLKIGHCIFSAEYSNIFRFEEQRQGRENLYSVFSSQEFLMLLSNVQKSFFEFHTFNSEMQKISVTDMIQHGAQILAGILFHEQSVFDASSRTKFKQIIWCLWAQIFEYGILTPAILNPEISEIMVNGFDTIYFEKSGKIIPAKIKFTDEGELLSLIERVCASMGRRIDESMPYCDSRLKEGHRVHAVVPPISLVGPCLTIRKFPNFSYHMKKLVRQDSLRTEAAEFLQNAIVQKKNIVISGGTGSGKTTLLNCLSVFIPEDERIITIEDSAELRLQQPHVIRLECRNENIENQGKITIRDLVKNALRMRPDRIIVGECRSAEALDMLQAMNTGHDGSMTTVHANSPQDALRRLETLALFSEVNLPSRAIREQLASAIHLIVQQSRLSCGKRCVTRIEKIIGFDDKNSSIKTETVYARN